jgi:hypothetical protein
MGEDVITRQVFLREFSVTEPFALWLFLSEVRTRSGSDEEAGVEGGMAMRLAVA